MLISVKHDNIERIGDVNMKLLLLQGKITTSSYSNNMGLKFDFKVKTNELLVKENKLIGNTAANSL